MVVFSGRAHYYERGDAAAMRVPIATLKALGCDTLLLTNAAGSLRTEVGPGEIMLITDHINFAGANPLIGEPTDDRFVGMTGAYDASLRAALLGAAEREGIRLTTGVYMWFSGPTFETPAEIRMARTMGADAVGMSTVPEVILGRFYRPPRRRRLDHHQLRRRHDRARRSPTRRPRRSRRSAPRQARARSSAASSRANRESRH